MNDIFYNRCSNDIKVVPVVEDCNKMRKDRVRPFFKCNVKYTADSPVASVMFNTMDKVFTKTTKGLKDEVHVSVRLTFLRFLITLPHFQKVTLGGEGYEVF